MTLEDNNFSTATSSNPTVYISPLRDGGMEVEEISISDLSATEIQGFMVQLGAVRAKEMLNALPGALMVGIMRKMKECGLEKFITQTLTATMPSITDEQVNAKHRGEDRRKVNKPMLIDRRVSGRRGNGDTASLESVIGLKV